MSDSPDRPTPPESDPRGASARQEGSDSRPADAAPPDVSEQSTVASVSPPVDHDAARRAFFRQFGRQAVATAGQVAGMATIVNRVTGTAVANLLGLAEPARRGLGAAPILTPSPGSSAATRAPVEAGVSSMGAPGVPAGGAESDAVPGAEHRFRSPYRMVGQELVLLDQRTIPESLSEVVAKRGSDVAYHLRVGLVRGGALIAQVAAIGLSLTAQERAAQSAEMRGSEMRRTAEALVQARPSVRLLPWAVQRMERRRAELDAADGAAVAAALRTEAGAIAAELQAHQANAARTLAEVLAGLAAQDPHRPLGVLVHGDPGALAGGLVGIGLTALRRLRDEGQSARVFVTETRPFMDGARLASWELRQAGIDHKVVPDAMVAWLLQQEPIDVVLVSAEWVAANGDAAAVAGSRGVALQAVAMPGWAGVSQPAVIVCATSLAIDADTPDGDAIPTERRPVREMTAYLTGVPIRTTDVLLPATDVIPAAAITALVTERGVVAPVTAEGIAIHLAAAASSSPTP